MIWLKENFSIFKNKTFLCSLIFSILALIFAFVIHHISVTYANKMASSSVADIFLSNIRVFDVDWVFVYGPVLFYLFILITVSLKHFRRLPFLLYSISLFTIIRSLFVCLTHLGPFPTQASIGIDSIFNSFSVGNDFFFSGHTGLPFLVALIFWDILPIRIVSLLASIFFGIVVLLGHYHYTIDVLSAFFITFSIYEIAKVFFKKERKFFILT